MKCIAWSGELIYLFCKKFIFCTNLRYIYDQQRVTGSSYKDHITSVMTERMRETLLMKTREQRIWKSRGDV